MADTGNESRPATRAFFDDARRYWRLMSAYERFEELVVYALSLVIAIVVVIALLAISRKFVILDLSATTSSMVAALSGTTVGLGAVYWLLSRSESPLRSP